MSMAEVIKSFHFYFLSHDEGLFYEYLDDGYHHSLITPFEFPREAWSPLSSQYPGHFTESGSNR